MFCPNCGNEWKETDKFCAQCGTYNERYRAPEPPQASVEMPIEEDSLTGDPVASEPAAPVTVPPVAEQGESDVLYGYEPAQPFVTVGAPTAEAPKQEAPAVFGILALIFSIVDSPVGLVFSIIGMCLYKEKGSVNRKRATAGLIISIVLLALMIVGGIALAVFELIAQKNGWITPLSDWYAFFEYIEYMFG